MFLRSPNLLHVHSLQIDGSNLLLKLPVGCQALEQGKGNKTKGSWVEIGTAREISHQTLSWEKQS